MAYQKNKNGKTVKFDKDKSNDYQDGYNAGRRYAKEGNSKLRTVFYIVMALLLLMAVGFASYRKGQADESKDITPVRCIETIKEKVEEKVNLILPETGGK